MLYFSLSPHISYTYNQLGQVGAFIDQTNKNETESNLLNIPQKQQGPALHEIDEDLKEELTSEEADQLQKEQEIAEKKQRIEEERLKVLAKKKEKDDYKIANSTLGFGNIFYINLPDRYAHDDAIVLQSVVTGIEAVQVDGVLKATLNEHGLPPSSGYVHKGAKACYRAHANLWKRIVRDNLDTALILEGDAAWDMNVRGIMAQFSRGLEQLMQKMKFITPGGNDTWTIDDPYNFKHWDVIQLGGCFPPSDGKDDSVAYPDPYVLPGLNYYGKPIDNQRVVRWRSKEVCTTGYAVSRRGALKLLTRSNVDMNAPVDLVIRGMVDEKQLDLYAVYPNVFVQWEYEKGLGASDKNSDLREGEKEEMTGEEIKKAWDKAHKTLNVWTYSGGYTSSKFKDCALNHLKASFFDGKSDQP